MRAVSFWCSLISAVVLAPTAACGGGGGSTPTSTVSASASKIVIVTADLSGVQDQSATLHALGRVLQDRFAAAGLEAEVSEIPNDTVTVTYSADQPDAVIQQLVRSGGINFREPMLSVDAHVKCWGIQGEFSVAPSVISRGEGPTGQVILGCTDDSGQQGQVQWEPPTLTSAMVDSAELKTDQQRGDFILLTFDDEGARIFGEMTRRLINYPIGVFLDSSLLTAPTVQSEIVDGQVVITGLDREELTVPYAVLKGGELPVRLTDVEFPSP